MNLVKKQYPNITEYTKAIIELTKAGVEIDMAHTRSVFGRLYTVAYYEAEQEASLEATPEVEQTAPKRGRQAK
jgi:hypothetical protein